MAMYAAMCYSACRDGVIAEIQQEQDLEEVAYQQLHWPVDLMQIILGYVHPPSPFNTKKDKE